jgi:hypothetical protein
MSSGPLRLCLKQTKRLKIEEQKPQIQFEWLSPHLFPLDASPKPQIVLPSSQVWDRILHEIGVLYAIKVISLWLTLW